MVMLLKRLLTLGLALAFLIGVTAQLVPLSMADTPTTVSARDGGLLRQSATTLHRESTWPEDVRKKQQRLNREIR